LNYKRIPYKTIFIEFPDIEKLYKDLGIPASLTRADGVTPYYTLPLIHDDSTDRYISNSLLIAEYLDETYPDTPQLVPKGTHGLMNAFVDHLFTLSLQEGLYRITGPKILSFLSPRSQEYVIKTIMGGAPPPPSELTEEEQWAKVETGVFGKVLKWYRNPEDLFLNGGDKPDFADIQLLACFQWLKAAFGADSTEWKRMQQWHGGKWAKLDAAMAEFH